MHTASQYNEALQKLADEYFSQANSTTATTKEIAVWALRNGKWDAPEDLVLRKCREDFARALREQYIEDARGNPVRAKHVARIKRGDEQLYLWADIRRAPREHMEIAFQQQRRQIVGDCRQLKRDVGYYNDAHPTEPGIQLLLDFTEDVEEGEFAKVAEVAC
jgi:hypothetical protein